MNRDKAINTTGQVIQEMRIRAGLTQQALADALHVTDKVISKWERGVYLPDTMLLPKLALILDLDLDVLISMSINVKEWVGLIDIKNADFSQMIYDKPLIYYILSHYLLLGINKIHILSTENNIRFLKDVKYENFGFNFLFTKPKNKNVMMINKPWFLFGSDLTQQFLGAILSNRLVKLSPEKRIQYFILSHLDLVS